MTHLELSLLSEHMIFNTGFCDMNIKEIHHETCPLRVRSIKVKFRIELNESNRQNLQENSNQPKL